MSKMLGLFYDGGDNASHCFAGVFENMQAIDTWIETCPTYHWNAIRREGNRILSGKYGTEEVFWIEEVVLNTVTEAVDQCYPDKPTREQWEVWRKEHGG